MMVIRVEGMILTNLSQEEVLSWSTKTERVEIWTPDSAVRYVLKQRSVVAEDEEREVLTRDCYNGPTYGMRPVFSEES